MSDDRNLTFNEFWFHQIKENIARAYAAVLEMLEKRVDFEMIDDLDICWIKQYSLLLQTIKWL